MNCSVFHFLLKLLLLCGVLAAITLVVLKRSSQEFVDLFYGKFLRPAPSLILGSSRAAQGIDPSSMMEAGENNSTLNFAFTNANSPYGPVYLEAIRHKLSAANKDAVFILEVNPLLLSLNEKEKNDTDTWRENDLTLDRQITFNEEPNYEYLLRNYRQPLYKLALGYASSDFQTLHSNGWLEQRVSMESKEVAKRKERMLASYRDVFKKHRPSPQRMEWLAKTVGFLKQHGRVVLVRIPTSGEMADLEYAYWEDFSQDLQALSQKHDAEYFDLISQSDTAETIDGHHLSISAAKALSKRLGALLKSNP